LIDDEEMRSVRRSWSGQGDYPQMIDKYRHLGHPRESSAAPTRGGAGPRASFFKFFKDASPRRPAVGLV